MTSPSSAPRVTLVTGGGRGIGAAICRRLAREGHAVVVGFRSDATAAESIVAEISDGGGRALAVRVDVTDPASLDAFVAAGERLGPITGVVANAGAATAVGTLADNDPAAIRADLDVNLFGVIATVRAALARMDAGGAVVTISSAAATLGSPGSYVHYAAAKAGVEAFTVGLSKEVATRGIRVNAVAPGTIWTEFHQDPERPAKVAPTVPMGRAGEPDEIAGAVAWLLSDDASYATGAVLRVAGGL
ncbi:SDR family NAD(P)-dependent oxidoreductase [Schumannella sp. 10F1B-5-1]|uniref:SDR family NAD(P)-dependent oxidoreductase n=1 Tax=Schumannella sp. 10F1B-5-1 TaxID=2590780 RepID=UPI001130475F|nr:SDR family oxidoreductase [Schumannella sp. 10F1B-5-1]TPW73481.1 SDR family oxidoreductase [Schumannella sp. 10F1B-5-1]